MEAARTGRRERYGARSGVPENRPEPDRLGSLRPFILRDRTTIPAARVLLRMAARPCLLYRLALLGCDRVARLRQCPKRARSAADAAAGSDHWNIHRGGNLEWRVHSAASWNREIFGDTNCMDRAGVGSHLF